MSTAVVMALAAFAALWAIPVLSTRIGPAMGSGHSRQGWALLLYGGGFAAAAWWWGVPLEAQKSVRDLTTSADPASIGVGCGAVTSNANQFERASNGQLDFRDDGSVLLDPRVWQAMNGEQRDAFIMFADKVAACTGSTSSSHVAVKDIVTGARLNDDLP